MSIPIIPSRKEIYEHAMEHVRRKDKWSFEHYLLLCALRDMEPELYDRIKLEFECIMEDNNYE